MMNVLFVNKCIKYLQEKMPACVVPGCRNHSRFGTKMCSFPEDPHRRAVWVKNAQLLSNLKERSALCEV